MQLGSGLEGGGGAQSWRAVIVRTDLSSCRLRSPILPPLGPGSCSQAPPFTPEPDRSCSHPCLPPPPPPKTAEVFSRVEQQALCQGAERRSLRFCCCGVQVNCSAVCLLCGRANATVRDGSPSAGGEQSGPALSLPPERRGLVNVAAPHAASDVSSQSCCPNLLIRSIAASTWNTNHVH